MRFTFDVFFATHDEVMSGAHDAGWHRVTVDGNDWADAQLAAAQMVVATHPDTMPTATLAVL